MRSNPDMSPDQPAREEIPTAPIGVFLYAESYLRAAEALAQQVDAGNLRLRRNGRVYNLLGHAVAVPLYIREQTAPWPGNGVGRVRVPMEQIVDDTPMIMEILKEFPLPKSFRAHRR